MSVLDFLISFAPECRSMMKITSAQIRAARALIGWTQSDLAQAAGVSEIAITKLERGTTDPRVSTINNIREALDQAGVIFVDSGDTRDGGPGVRLKKRGDG